MKRNPILEQARQIIDRDKHPLEWLIQQMENDPWFVKLGRWFRLQKWILYCHLFNNKLCRYFKYRKLEKNGRK